MNEWKFEIVKAISGPLKPQVLTFAELLDLASSARPGLDPRTFKNFLKEAEGLGVLSKISNRAYLNLRSSPAPTFAEAAAFLKKDSVVSLDYVLGQAGVINNPSRTYTCVVPVDSFKQPSLGDYRLEGKAFFQFFGLPSRMFYDPANHKDSSLFLQGFHATPRATIEKALLDRIHLGYSPRSRLSPLPEDLDLESVDFDRLFELSELLEIRPILDRFVSERSNLVPSSVKRKVGKP